MSIYHKTTIDWLLLLFLAMEGWVIDIGPKGGDLGGQIVAEGTPEQVADNPNSVTGSFLKKALN